MPVTFDMVLHTWSTKRPGVVTLCLKREFRIQRRLTPRIVADTIDHAKFTADLTASVWEIWFPLPEGLESTPSDVRTAVRLLLKTNPLISGIRNITDYYLSSIEVDTWTADGVLTRLKRPCIRTSGSNLSEVCKLPWVDIVHPTTNDLMELYTLFGIDAMRTAIENNLLHVMASNSADVSRRYIGIIAHEMCRTGIPCALTFVGLTQSETSTLKLATFERSLESFVRAACSRSIARH